MCVYCSVGGLTFSIECDGVPWNFEHFQCEKADNLLFRLTVRDDVISLSHDGLTQVHVDMFEADMPRLEIYKKAGGWVLLTAMYRDSEICSRLESNEDFSVNELTISTSAVNGFAVRDFAINNAAMMLYAFTALKYKVLELHASVVVKGDRGFLFLGKSGTGKSTHSRLWQEVYSEAWLLNDDNPVVRIQDDGIWVYGSPWSGKTPCYKNESCRVGAFVQLRQAAENTIERCRPSKSYIFVYGGCSGLKFVDSVRDELYAVVSALVGEVPVWELGCLPNHDAARLCAQTCLS